MATTHTFYSIISIQSRKEVDEKISAGILLTNGEQLFYAVSRKKVNIAKELLGSFGLDIVKSFFFSFDKEVAKILTASIEDEKFMIKGFTKENLFNINYFEYLSRYNNNIISFSSPKLIDIDCSEENFKRLFSKFIYSEEAIITQPKKEIVKEFKTRFTPVLESYFNVDQTISPEQLPNLVMDVKVDFAGQNEIPVFTHIVDLNRPLHNIKTDVGEIFMIKEAYDIEGKKIHSFLVTAEPDKEHEENHKLWQTLRKNPTYEYVDIKEGEKILEYAQKHNVHPLFG